MKKLLIPIATLTLAVIALDASIVPTLSAYCDPNRQQCTCQMVEVETKRICGCAEWVGPSTKKKCNKVILCKHMVLKCWQPVRRWGRPH
jgi:hypothetical protein